jgi:hypothetical protein
LGIAAFSFVENDEAEGEELILMESISGAGSRVNVGVFEGIGVVGDDRQPRVGDRRPSARDGCPPTVKR